MFLSSLYILDGCQDLTSHHTERLVDLSENGDKFRSLQIGQLSLAPSMVHPGQTLYMLYALLRNVHSVRILRRAVHATQSAKSC